MNAEQAQMESGSAPLSNGIYRPELLSRRGEWIAWGSALIVWIAWLVLRLRGMDVVLAMPIVAILLVLAAVSISLGNWMDRKTTLAVDDDTIAYRNGLRDVKMEWQDIQELRVLPARWGKKVQVIGEKSYFEFRTLGLVSVQNEEKGRIGFAEGEELLQTILERGRLEKIDQAENGEYYLRQ